MSFESPFKVLYNNAGSEVAVVSGSAMNHERPGIAVLAKDDSGNAQFLNMNASGELLVNATVDVDLDYSTDSVKVYGSQDAALVQDAVDSYLLVRDNDAKDAIDGAKMAITGAVESMDSNLGGKLDTLDSSVGAVETAVDNASSAISGAVDSMNSNLGGKLDTLDGSVDAVSGAIDALRADFNAEDFAQDATMQAATSSLAVIQAIDFAKDATVQAATSSLAVIQAIDFAKDATLQAATSSLVAIEAVDFATEASLQVATSSLAVIQAIDFSKDATLQAATSSLAAIEAVDFATEATLSSFKSDNHTDLVALSSSLDRFTFNGSNELLVNATVDVDLDYTTDSVKVYGSQDVSLQQSAAHSNALMVIDTDVSGAIVAMENVLEGQLSSLNAVDFATEASLQVATSSLAVIQAIDFAKDATLQAATSSLAVIEAVDFATEASLQVATSSLAVIQAIDFAKDATMQAATSSLAVIQAVDFAKDATVQAATSSLAVIQAIDFSKDATLQAATSSLAVIEAVDFATEASLQVATSSLAVIQAIDFSKDATLQAATSSLAVIQAVDFSKDATLQAATSSLAVIEAVDFATEATLLNVSTSLDRFQFDGSELLVKATVDVDLDYATDSVTIYGDEGLMFAQVSGSGEMITMPIGSEGFAFLQAASGSVHHSDDNSALLVGLMGSNSQNVLLSSTDDVLYVSAALNDPSISTNLSALAAVDFATEASLQVATSSLAVIQAIDFAKDATMQAATSSLAVIEAIDFAKDASLQAATSSLAVIQAIDFAKDATVQAATSSLAVIQAIDFAKDASLQAATSSLAVIQAIDFSKDATLQAATSSLAALEGALNGGGTALVVEATDLDIRDLSSATDSVTAHQGGDWYVHQSGSWVVDRVVATSATVVAESINASSVEVIAGGAAEFGASFYWSSPAGSVCYIRLGDTAASSSVYTVKLVNGGYYEMPERWAGKVQAISDATGGTLLVTKLD